MPNPFDTLRNRVAWFLRSNLFARAEVASLAQTLLGSGEVAVFGGMLRDLSQSSNREFSSDVDLVVELRDETELQNILAPYQSTTNSFGGYAVQLYKWRVDVWRLSDTWAIREGLVEGATFEALPATTFFDWDGIAMDLRSRRIHCLPGYFERLDHGVVDINLASNPNPVGACVRTLHILARQSATISADLASYLSEGLAQHSNAQLCAMSRRQIASGKGGAELRSGWIDSIRSRLANHLVQCPTVAFGVSDIQEELPLDRCESQSYKH